MELRDLRALVAVVRSGSFTAAAAELGYTQSAVSQQVASLEQELGHRLVERRPVRPTPAGLRLVEHGTRILLRVDVVRSELARLDDASGELRVDACPLAAPAALAGALRQLRRANPSVRVTVRSTDARTAVAHLADGVIDVALIDGIVPPENPLDLTEPGLLSATGLIEEPVTVVLQEGHPLAARASLDLSTLADAPWVVSPALPSENAAPGPPLAVTYTGSDVVMVLALVAAGLGVALLPASTWCPFAGVVTVPLGEPKLVHRTEALTLRSARLLATSLVEELRIRARANAAVAPLRS
jgi:DNA-binding transcriptional LysR family regulator